MIAKFDVLHKMWYEKCVIFYLFLDNGRPDLPLEKGFICITTEAECMNYKKETLPEKRDDGRKDERKNERNEMFAVFS